MLRSILIIPGPTSTDRSLLIVLALSQPPPHEMHPLPFSCDRPSSMAVDTDRLLCPKLLKAEPFYWNNGLDRQRFTML